MIANQERPREAGAQHGADEFVIRKCFVDETPAVLIDDEAAGLAAIGDGVGENRGAGVIAGKGRNRGPERRIDATPRQRRADRARQTNAIAAITGESGGKTLRWRRQERRPQRRIMRKPAAREHHTAPDRKRLPACNHALHPSFGENQLCCRSFEAEIDAKAEQRQKQPPGERVAEHERGAARPGQTLPGIGREPTRNHQRRARRAGNAAEMREIAAPDHHAAERCELGNGRAEPREMPPQRPAIEGHRLEHPPAQRRPREIGVIIGIARDRLKTKLGARRKRGDGGGSVGEEAFAPRVRLLGADDVIEIGPGSGDILRRPDHAARGRGGAADRFRLFEQDHGKSFGRAQGGRRHAGGAGADHRDVNAIGGAPRHQARLGVGSQAAAGSLWRSVGRSAPAVLPASLPNTAPLMSPVPPG